MTPPPPLGEQPLVLLKFQCVSVPYSVGTWLHRLAKRLLHQDTVQPNTAKRNPDVPCTVSTEPLHKIRFTCKFFPR